MAEAPAATFVFADLAGYTALTAAHGDEHAADTAAAFVSEVRQLLADYEAEAIKSIGDALLIRAQDADQAVHLAARIMEDLGGRDRSLGIRIGMHTGTAVRRGDDWFGVGVNIAARIADLAESGEILMSDETRHAARRAVRPDQLQSLGRRELKHVHEPVEIHVLHPAGDSGRQLPIDPVCHMALEPTRCEARRVHRGVEYRFCSTTCAAAFDRSADRYVGRPASGRR